jgi:hypothetical protein
MPIRPSATHFCKHLTLLQPRLNLFGGVCAAICCRVHVLSAIWDCVNVCNLQPSITFTIEKERRMGAIILSIGTR